jgi:hypothetical protein
VAATTQFDSAILDVADARHLKSLQLLDSGNFVIAWDHAGDNLRVIGHLVIAAPFLKALRSAGTSQDLRVQGLHEGEYLQPRLEGIDRCGACLGKTEQRSRRPETDYQREPQPPLHWKAR